MIRPPGIKSLKEQIEEGEACDWEEYTREERYAFMDMAVLIEYIEFLEAQPRLVPVDNIEVL